MQDEPPKSFTLSENRRKFTIAELKNKILNLIKLDIKFMVVPDDYVGRNFIHRFVVPEDEIETAIELHDVEEKDDIVYAYWRGKIETAILSKKKDAPIVYICTYEKFPDETYAFTKNELTKDIYDNSFIFV